MGGEHLNEAILSSGVARRNSAEIKASNVALNNNHVAQSGS